MVYSRKKKLLPPSVRRASQYAALTAFLLLFLWSGSAQADNQIITEPTDIWFEYTEPTQFNVRTYQSEGINSDPQLWLYTEQGDLIASNDDYFGLQSNITIDLEPGRYRLRAGVCCGEPDVWRSGNDWNLQYELSSSVIAVSTTTTSTSTTTTTVPLTTTTTTSTTTTQPVQTTTTTEPEPVVVTVPTTTTQPPQTTTTYLPVPVQTTTTLPLPTSTVPQSTTSTTLPVTVDTSLPEIKDVVTPAQAVALATDPEVLATATVEEATKLFEVLDVNELSEEQASQLVEAVQSAPSEVRQAFEKTINIFGGQVDTYVPLGSTIPVSQRRALIAITAALFAAPVVVQRKR